MPRIELKKKEYMIMDLAAWIIGRMHSKGITQKELAEKLGIKQGALSARLNPKQYKKGEMKDPFTYGNLLTIFAELEATDEEKRRLMSL